jgi:hypothetical protein
MTAEQYKAAISKLGLSQVRAGKFFGYSPRVGQSWCLGEYPVPEVVAMLVAVMLKHEVAPETLEAAQNRNWGVPDAVVMLMMLALRFKLSPDDIETIRNRRWGKVAEAAE